MIQNGHNSTLTTTTDITIKLWYFWKFDINSLQHFMVPQINRRQKEVYIFLIVTISVKYVIKGFKTHKWNHFRNKSNNLMVKFTICDRLSDFSAKKKPFKIANLSGILKKKTEKMNGEREMVEKEILIKKSYWKKKKREIEPE